MLKTAFEGVSEIIDLVAVKASGEGARHLLDPVKACAPEARFVMAKVSSTSTSAYRDFRPMPFA